MPTTRPAGERGPQRSVVETWREDPAPASRWRRVLIAGLAAALLLLAGIAGGYALKGQDRAQRPVPVAGQPLEPAAELTAVFVILPTQEQALRLEAAMPPERDPVLSRATRNNWFVVIQAGTQGESDMLTAIKPFLESGYTVRIADLRGP